MRFTIGKLLFATAVIAVFLGLRSGYVFASDDDLATIVDRAWWVPWAMAVIVSATSAHNAQRTPGDGRSFVTRRWPAELQLDYQPRFSELKLRRQFASSIPTIGIGAATI